jgi:hypothetical protein
MRQATIRVSLTASREGAVLAIAMVGIGAEIVQGVDNHCDEYSHAATTHCMTLYKYSLLNLIRAFPSEGRRSWVRRYCKLARAVMRTSLRVPPGTYIYL